MWRTAIEVPVGAELEYKLVHLPAAAEAPRWEEADNHSFKAALEARAKNDDLAKDRSNILPLNEVS